MILLWAVPALVAVASFYAGVYYVAGSERRRQMLSWTTIALLAAAVSFWAVRFGPLGPSYGN
jgi:hypothetical protein